MRIEKLGSNRPIIKRGKQVTVMINEKPTIAFEGEMVSSVLHAEGIRTFHHKHKTGKPAGIYCGMGICYECLVCINGVPNIRACQTPVSDGMNIITSIEERS